MIRLHAVFQVARQQRSVLGFARSHAMYMLTDKRKYARVCQLLGLAPGRLKPPTTPRGWRSAIPRMSTSSAVGSLVNASCARGKNRKRWTPELLAILPEWEVELRGKDDGPTKLLNGLRCLGSTHVLYQHLSCSLLCQGHAAWVRPRPRRS